MRTKPLSPAATALRTPGPAVVVNCRDTAVPAVNCSDMAARAGEEMAEAATHKGLEEMTAAGTRSELAGTAEVVVGMEAAARRRCKGETVAAAAATEKEEGVSCRCMVAMVEEIVLLEVVVALCREEAAEEEVRCRGAVVVANWAAAAAVKR